jgi:exodeoxyribonuclease VII small subunit
MTGVDGVHRRLTLESAELSFEQAFATLETTVGKLESGGLTLAQSVALYEEGMRLATLCGRQLDAAELRVSRLATAESGQQTETPLEERP